MKIIAILLILATVLAGMSEGNCTSAVVFALLFAPAIFERKEGVKNERGKRRCRPRSHARACV